MAAMYSVTLRVLRSIRKEYHQRSTRASSSASAGNVNYSRGLTTGPSRRKDTIMTSTAKLASLRPTSRVSSSSGASLSSSSCISGRTSSSDDSQSKSKSGSSCSGGGGGNESQEMKPPNSSSYSAGIIQERRMSNRQRKPSCRLHFDPSKLCCSGKSINVRSDGSSADRKRGQGGCYSSLDKDSKTDHQGRVIKQHPNTNTKMPRLGQRLRSTAASTSSSSSNNLRLAVKKYLVESDNGADDESTPNFDPKGNQKQGALSSNPELLSAVGPMNECYCVRNEAFFADGCLPPEKELVGKDFDIQPFCQV
jgi:hypothetical protein